MRVQLMATCLGDVLRPAAVQATVEILHRLGHQVEFPWQQTCCGQPLYNSGYAHWARRQAQHTIEVFSQSDDPVVTPSGSCAAMVKVEYLHLFEPEEPWHDRARELAQRTFELSDFLVNVLQVEDLGARYQGRVAYHFACHLRVLGLEDEPLRLIRRVEGVELVELARADQCCGFGGSFSVRYGDISGAMVRDKAMCILASGADTVVSTDTGCLMNIGGYLHRRQIPVRVMHLAELLNHR